METRAFREAPFACRPFVMGPGLPKTSVCTAHVCFGGEGESEEGL